MSHDPGGDWTVRAVLVLGILSGLAYVVETAIRDPAQFGLASDVYYHAARALLEGGNIYEVAPPDHPDYTYIYPPVVILAFVPHALLGSEAAALGLQTVLNLGAGVGTGLVLLRALDRRGVVLARFDRWLVVGTPVGSGYALSPIVEGQVTPWLALALAIGFDALDRDRETLAGGAFAGAALVKVFPAAVGLWLVRRRAWRGLAVAVVTGLGGLLVGAVLFGPDLTVQYFAEVLVGRAEGATFDGRLDPSVSFVTARRQVVALGVPSGLVTPVTVGVLAPVLAVLYRRVDTDRRRLAAILGTLVVTLLAMPLEALYFSFLLYPLVVLAYLLPAGPARVALLVGTLLTYVRPDPEVVAMVVGPLPGAIETAAVAAAETAFAFVMPPTLGMWLLVTACVLVRFDVGTTADDRPDGSTTG